VCENICGLTLKGAAQFDVVFSVVTSVDILEDALRELRLDGVLKIKHTPGRHTNQAYATGRTTTDARESRLESQSLF